MADSAKYIVQIRAYLNILNIYRYQCGTPKTTWNLTKQVSVDTKIVKDWCLYDNNDSIKVK